MSELVIRLRRVRIEPEREREHLINRLKIIIRRLERLIENPNTSIKIRLRAIDTLTRVIRMCYIMIRDVEIDSLEREIEALEKEET